MKGVVVDELIEKYMLYQAGARVGDLFTHWERLPHELDPQGDAGMIGDPFDWHAVEVNQGPRGTVKLIGTRGGEPLEVLVSVDQWGCEMRPVYGSAAFETWRSGREKIREGDFQAGMEQWHQLAKEDSSSWIWLQIANAARDHGDLKLAEFAYTQALGLAESVAEKLFISEHKRQFLETKTLWNDSFKQLEQEVELWRSFKHGEVGQALVFSAMGTIDHYRRNLVAANEYHQKAFVTLKEKAPDSLALSDVLINLGSIQGEMNRFVEAEKYFREALRIIELKDPGTPRQYGVVSLLSRTIQGLGNLEEAQRILEQKLAVQEEGMSVSVEMANAFSQLGQILLSKGQFSQAKAYYHKARIALEEKASVTVFLSRVYNGLGVIESHMGDYDEAIFFFKHALSINEKLFPNSLYVASSLANLGNIAQSQGDLIAAEKYFKDSLVITEKKGPKSGSMASTFNNLGILMHFRKDEKEAELYFRKALAIYEEIAPDSSELATTLNNLSSLLMEGGEDVEPLLIRALEIQQKFASESLEVSQSLVSIGALAAQRGDFNKAEEHYRLALEIQRKIVPDSLDMGKTLKKMANLAWDQNQLEDALATYRHVAKIEEEKMTWSYSLAQTYMMLGRCLDGLGEVEEARTFFERSLDIFNTQLCILGGSQRVKTSFMAQSQTLFREYMAYLVKNNDVTRAFEINEKSRSNVLRAMMAERDLVISSDDVPQELEAQRKFLAYSYERTLLDLNKGATKEANLKALDNYRRKYEEVEWKIRSMSPRLNSLRSPKVLDLEQVRESLEAGTLLLTYTFLEDRCILFLVQKNRPLKMISINHDEAYFKELVPRWTQHVQRSAGVTRGKMGEKLLDRVSHELSDLLLGQAWDSIEKAERLVVMPDGPLWYLSFGALLVSKPGEVRRYLAEEKPVTSIASATLYAELKQIERREVKHIAAMGDAIYPGERKKDAGVLPEPVYSSSMRSLAGRRPLEDLKRIPQTAREIKSIERLFGSAVHSYLREDANETNFKRLDSDLDIVHVAAHGVIDDDRPLNSALLLTINDDFQEGEENGVVFAWEIFESMRLNADLVVLSACETGLGDAQGGEGLIGLTRAFQFAGARSIIASYWNVDDRSTAELMNSFYRHLKKGKPKAEALQQAQIEMIRSGKRNRNSEDMSHPYYWAAFQLIGPWN